MYLPILREARLNGPCDEPDSSRATGTDTIRSHALQRYARNLSPLHRYAFNRIVESDHWVDSEFPTSSRTVIAGRTMLDQLDRLSCVLAERGPHGSAKATGSRV